MRNNLPKLSTAIMPVYSLGFALFSLTSHAEAGTVPSKPNFLILISDDQRWDQLSYSGKPIIPELKTPNLDRLAASGVYFYNAFATSPICAVSRASIMTGRDVRSHGMRHFKTPLKEDVLDNTYPAILKKEGYRTGMLGKWGIAMTGTEKIFDVCNAWAEQGAYFHNTETGRIHNSEWLALQTKEFLGSCKTGQPFCLTVSYKAPHHPYQPDERDKTLFKDVSIPKRKSDTPEAYAGMSAKIMENSLNRWCYFDERKDEKTRNDFEKDFLRCVVGLDRSVGEIMKSLEELHLDQNTIVIFLSDNGYLWGEHGLGGKWLLYEESIRVPLIIKWPGMQVKNRGNTLQQLALNIDIAPTILDLAGIKVPDVMDGKSLLPIINEQSADLRSDFFMEHAGFVNSRKPIPDSRGIRTKDWKYIRYVDKDFEVEEMYNLSADPMELRNLIDDKDFAGVKSDLRKRYKHYLDSAPETDERSPENSSKDHIINQWSFDNDVAGSIIDNIQKKQDGLFGKYEYVKGLSGKALKFDGFRTYALRQAMEHKSLGGDFSVEAWIAPAAYPWARCPVLDCTGQDLSGFFLGIDSLGHVVFRVAVEDSWVEVTSKATIPLGKWSHIAGIIKADEQMTVFINGENAGSVKVGGAYTAPKSGLSSAAIGRNNNPQVWKEPQLTTPDAFFFLDGLLDDIRIYSNARSARDISAYVAGAGKLSDPELSKRGNFPKGPAGSGTFGAFYTKLDYYKEWDDLWRVGDKTDVFVRFAGSPVQLVFWRGTSFVPCWVSENDIWYTSEWLETWGKDVVSCAEPLMDRQCRFSHVRIIENNPARVVVHWRYALVDAFYNFVNIGADGQGEWCDEYYITYPDNIGVRKIDLHYSTPERKHDWVEQIVLTPPGRYPADLIEKAAVTLVNMKGETKDYVWHDKLEKEMPEPKCANISCVNLKSEYRPFIIIPPDPVDSVEGKWDAPYFRTYAANMAKKGIRPDPAPTVYGWWNHWPVAMIPGDGRWIETPDKPGHFNLTTFVQWKDHNKTEKTRTRIMLHGMTNKKAGELVAIAKSWINAPKMMISSEGFEGGLYDAAERAYAISKTAKGPAPLELNIKGSEESPVINPALIIKNWGKATARISVNGKLIQQEDSARQGIRSTLDGDDLIVWLKIDSKDNIRLNLN